MFKVAVRCNRAALQKGGLFFLGDTHPPPDWHNSPYAQYFFVWRFHF